ncbi:MAG: heptosyltransferase-2 [Flavobacteriales bacterium]
MATAALEALAHRFPSAQLDLLVRKGNETLFLDHPFLNEVHIWDKKAGKYPQLWKCLKRIRSEKYDLVVNFQRFASSGLLTAFSGAKIKHGFSKNPLSFLFSKAFPHLLGKKGEVQFLHEIDRNHALIQEWCGERTLGPKLYPPSLPEDLAIESPFLVIAPSSVWFTKQYPFEKWLELLNSFENDNRTIYLIGAPSDKAIAGKLCLETVHQNVVNLCGKLNLLQSAKLMEGAQMSYVNDSAPLHLASAVDAPVTAIFCSTIPEFGFGPSGTKGKVVQVNASLACRPCGLHGRKECPLKHFNCAHWIDVQELRAQADRIS